MMRYVKFRRFVPLFCVIAILLVICACARTPEQKHAKFLERGTAQLKNHDYARAILEFRNAIRAKPKSAEAYYQMALAYIGARDMPRAIHFLEKALELDPKYTAAELKLSELAVATHSPAESREAERHVRKVLESSPANVDALDILAKAEWQLGNQEEAEKLLSQAFAQSPQDLKLSAHLAQIKLWNKDIAGAEATLKKAADDNPGSAAAAVILGRFYVAVARSNDAERQFERALKLDPKNGAALLSMAAIRWRAGQIGKAEQLYQQTASLPDAQYKSVHAMFLFQSGKRDLAISEFEKLYRRDPADRAGRTQLIIAYEAVGRTSDAEKLLATVLKKNPKDVDALLEESAVYLRNGDSTQAQADLAAVRRFRPDSAPAHYMLARVDQMRGKPQMQKQELAEALRLNPNLLPARLQLSEWLISNKAAKEARDLLDETPQSQKHDVAVLLHLNWAALALGDRTAARSGIDRVLANSRQPQVLVQDATLKMLGKDYVGGRRSLQEALQKEPDDPEALSLMVQSYEVQKQLPAAVEWLREYAGRRPKSAPVQFYLGQVLMKSGETGPARAAFLAAKATDPTLTGVDLNLAQLDMRDEKLDEARQRLSVMVSRQPSDVSSRLLLGTVEQMARNYEASIEQYRKAVELDEGNVQALNDLAYVLAEFGKQPDEALKFAQKAEELAPNNAAVADTLGWVLYRKALYTSAMPYLEQGVSREPTGVRECHLALAYMKTGDQPRGEHALAAALRMDPDLARSELWQEVAASQRAAR